MRSAGSCAHMCCSSARHLSATSREGCPRRCARMSVPGPDRRSGLKMRSLQNAFLALALLALLAVLRLRAGGGLQSSICIQLRRGAGASASLPLFAGALHCLCSRAYWRTCRVSAAASAVPACAAFCLTLRLFFCLSLRRCGKRCLPLRPPPQPSLSARLSVWLSLSLARSLSRSLSEQLGVVSLTSALQISKCVSASSCSACAPALSGPASPPPASASASVYNMSINPTPPSPAALSACPTPPQSVTPPSAPPPPSA